MSSNIIELSPHITGRRDSSSSTNSDRNSFNMIRDWRKALKTQRNRKFATNTIRFNIHFVLILLCIITLFILFYFSGISSKSSNPNSQLQSSDNGNRVYSNSYNYTYPLSSSIRSDGMETYRIALIADLDTASRVDNGSKSKWKSYLKHGYLTYNPFKQTIVTSFSNDKTIELYGGYSLNGRGMELSELVTFNGRILTFDDRTGIVYELIDNKPFPWVILMDGNGKSEKGFKSEWATVKDEVLYVGSMGKEWTSSTGVFENFNPMYVKAVTMSGEVHHINWVDRYKKIRAVLDIDFPGYMIHESAAWSSIHRRWYFLPRRCSKEPYDEKQDEHMGCNVLISTDEQFYNVQLVKLGNYKSTQGFSSFKFIPGTNDSVIVALQTEEIDGQTTTYITAFKVDGKILLDSTIIDSNLKYEGIEFT